MATLATLVTMVTADTQGFRSEMGKAEGVAKQFSSNVGLEMEKVKEHGKGLNASIHSAVSGIKGNFGELLHIGLGVGAGRAIFHGLHEGILHLAEGYSEARKAGFGFFDSVSDGIDKLLGLKTLAERHAETMKAVAEVNHAAAKAQQEFNDALDRARGINPAVPYPNLPGGGEDVKSKLDAAREAASEANKKLGEKQQEIADQNEQRHRGLGLGYVGDSGFAKLKKDRDKLRDAANAAQAAVRQAEEDAGKANKEVGGRKDLGKVLLGGIFGGGGLTAQGLNTGLATRDQVVGFFQPFMDAAEGVGKKLGNMVARGAEGHFVHGDEKILGKAQRDEEIARIRESVKSPLDKLHDEFRHIDALKMPFDLETKAKAAAVADFRKTEALKSADDEKRKPDFGSVTDVWLKMQEAAFGGNDAKKQTDLQTKMVKQLDDIKKGKAFQFAGN